MKIFFGGIFAFLVGIIKYFVKKFGIAPVLLTIKIAVTTVYFGLLLVAYAFFMNFLFRLWTLFGDIVSNFNSLGLGASGTSYTVSNSQIVSAMWSFIHASGIDDAVMTAGSLFISLLAVYFAMQAYKMFIFVYDRANVLITDLMNLMLA